MAKVIHTVSSFVAKVMPTDFLFACCKQLWPKLFWLWAVLWPKWCWLIFCLHAASSYGQSYSDWFAVCVLSAVTTKTILILFACCEQLWLKQCWLTDYVLWAVMAEAMLTNSQFVCSEQLWGDARGPDADVILCHVQQPSDPVLLQLLQLDTPPTPPGEDNVQVSTVQYTAVQYT